MGKGEVVAEKEDYPDHSEVAVVKVVVEGEDRYMLTRSTVFLLSHSLVDLCSWKALSRSR